MENLVLLLPVLGCAAMMGVMMWMMRGNQQPAQPTGAQAEAGTREEIATLRAEVATLRAQRAETGGQAAGEPRSR